MSSDDKINKVTSSILQEEEFSYFKTLNKMFHTVLPMILYCLAFTLQKSITLSYLTTKYKLDQIDLINSIGITNIYINSTVACVSYGLLGGITSLGSNSYGSKDYYLMGLYIHRGRIVCIIYLIVTGIINFFFGHHILSIFVSSPKIIKLMEIYIKCQVFIQILDGLYHVNVEYLSIVEKGNINLIICIPNTIFHFLWCHIYINVLNLGVLGAGLSLITTQFFNLIISSLYIHIVNPCPESYFCLNKDCFIGLVSYIKYTSSEIAIVVCEGWSFEILGIIALKISKIDFTSYVLIMNISSNIWTINYGFHSGATIIIGTLITDSTIQIVKKTISFLFFIANFVMTAILILSAVFAPKIISLFINNAKNTELTELSLICLYIILFNFIFEVNQNLFSGIIRAFGRQKFIIIVMIITFYPLLISLSIIIGKIFKYGSKGLFISMTITYFTGFICYLIYFIRLKFNQIKIEIEERTIFDKDLIK